MIIDQMSLGNQYDSAFLEGFYNFDKKYTRNREICEEIGLESVENFFSHL